MTINRRSNSGHRSPGSGARCLTQNITEQVPANDWGNVTESVGVINGGKVQHGRLRDEFLNETCSPHLCKRAWCWKSGGAIKHGATSFAARLAAPAVYTANFLPQHGQGAALANGSAPWPTASTVQDGEHQTLRPTG